MSKEVGVGYLPDKWNKINSVSRDFVLHNKLFYSNSTVWIENH